MTGAEFLAQLNEAGMSADFGRRSRANVDIEAETEKWDRLLQRFDFVSHAKGDEWWMWGDDDKDWMRTSEPIVHDVLAEMGFNDFAERVEIMKAFKDRDSDTYRLGKDPRFKKRPVEPQCPVKPTKSQLDLEL